MLAAALGCASGVAMRPPLDLGPALPEPHALAGAASCAPESPAALAHCVERARLERDVVAIARPRPPGSAEHARVRELCVERLGALGLDVERQTFDGGVNVIGRKPGFTRPGEHVLVSAHYDHLPGCSGADDDASGLAVVLEAARVLAPARFDRTLLVACWDAAESGQRGSAAWAARARAEPMSLRAAFVLDAVGYASDAVESQRLPERFEEAFPDHALALDADDYRGNFALAVAERSLGTADHAALFARYGDAAGLRVHVLELGERHQRAQEGPHRSDHASLWERGLAAVLVTDTGAYRNPRFHCAHGDDTADTLRFDFLEGVARATVGATAELLEPRGEPARSP
jgi:hypothetical protein